MTFRLPLTACVFLFATSSMAVPPPLPDQYGKEAGMDAFTGQPVVVFVTSLTQLPNLGKWEEAMRPKVPTMNSMDIGDIDTTSGMTKALVIKELKKHVPDGVSVYIDAENLWAKEYNLDLSEPCVLVFDQDHNLVAQFRGKPDDDVLSKVVSEASKLFPEPEKT